MPEKAPVRFPAYRCTRSYPSGLAGRALNAKIVAEGLECSRRALRCSDKSRSVFVEHAIPEEVCFLHHRFARDAEQLFQRGAYKFEAERAAVSIRPDLVGHCRQAISHVAHFALGVMAC